MGNGYKIGFSTSGIFSTGFKKKLGTSSKISIP